MDGTWKVLKRSQRNGTPRSTPIPEVNVLNIRYSSVKFGAERSPVTPNCVNHLTFDTYLKGSAEQPEERDGEEDAYAHPRVC